MSLRIQDQYILPFFIFLLHSRYFSFTNPSLRIQERQEFKNETVIKNSRSFFIFPLHSRYFSFRNEPIIKNSRTNPSSRIQHHQEFKIKERDYKNVKWEKRKKKRNRHQEFNIKERDYKNVKRGQRMNPSSRIQDKGTRLRM